MLSSIRAISPQTPPASTAPPGSSLPPGSTPPSMPSSSAADDYVPGEVLFKSRGLGVDLASEGLHDLGIASLRRLPMPSDMGAAMGGDIFRARLEPGVAVPDALKRLQASEEVAWAEPNYRVRAFDTGLRTPDDLDPRLWGLRNIETPGADVHASEAWATTVGRRAPEGGPIIAILDSGIDLAHPDLQANLYTNPGEIPGDGIDNDGNGYVDDVHGHDFAAGKADPVDGIGHGTHTAGTVGAVGDNGQGVVGVAWQTSLLPLKFLDDMGFGDTAAAAEALLYAEKMGARVVNNSWGGMHFSQTLFEVIRSSHALQVCAAGNDGADSDNAPVYPAGYDSDNVIAVAATDARDQLAPFSNRGLRTVDIAAPGDKIFSTVPNGYDTKRGTSMAAPHVTGAAALVLSEFPQLTAPQLRERLLDSADPLPSLAGQVASGGRLNVTRALSHDHIAPAAVTDLSAEDVAADHVTLRWTATGDDGAVGTAARYDLHWRDEAGGQGSLPLSAARGVEPGLESARPIDDGQVAVGLPRPSTAGTPESFTLPLLPSGTPRTVRVALQAIDKVGNASPVALAEVMVPAAAVYFRDDFENGLGQWVAQGAWAIERDHGRTGVTDSLGGDYPPGADLRLTSHEVDLTGASHPELSFRGRWNVENKFDSLTVEASTDGGQTFHPLERLEGRTPWATHRIDLSGLAGQKVRLRFHIVSDGDIEMDGLHLDDVLVAEAPPTR